MSRGAPLDQGVTGIRFEFANVICGKGPVPGTLDDKPFVIATGQRRIELRMATIKPNEERPFRITLRPRNDFRECTRSGRQVVPVESFRETFKLLIARSYVFLFLLPSAFRVLAYCRFSGFALRLGRSFLPCARPLLRFHDTRFTRS